MMLAIYLVCLVGNFALAVMNAMLWQINDSPLNLIVSLLCLYGVYIASVGLGQELS